MAKGIRKKILPCYFEDVKKGIKTFEVRKDEDDIQVGDILILEEWKPDGVLTGGYTGRCIRKRVKYVLRDIPQYGLQKGYCVIGLEDINNGWIPYTNKSTPKVGNVVDVWLALEDGVYKALWRCDHFEWDNGRIVKDTPVAWMPYNVPDPYIKH